MSFFEEEQQPERAAEQAPEPRLLTRPDRPNPAPDESSPRQGFQWPVRAQEQREPKAPKEPRPARRRRRIAHLRHSRRLRVWTALGVAAAALLVVVAVGTVLWLRHAVTAALPVVDGRVQASGLRAAVTVTRDAQGVPTITATNLPDLLFAQGYVTAGDRLWQMDTLRRHAAGELAEVYGSAAVEHDRRQRILQMRAAADRAVAQLPADQMQQLEAYARGVNAYLDTHRDALPLEFKLLAYTPARWTPRDSLLVSLAMWQDLSTEFPRVLDREAFSAHLPAALVRDLYPVGSWRDKPPAAQTHDITAPHEVEQIPLDPSQSRLVPATPVQPQQMLAVSRALAGTGRCEGCRSGSNDWAVSGAHTATGAPLVSNDMHLGLSVPDIWYEASLHAELAGDGAGGGTRLDATGFTLPGTPFVIVGRNARVGWGVTNLGADVQDLRVEHLRGSGEATEAERPDGTWAPVTHHAEVIRVRNGMNVKLDVLSTTHANGAAEMETPIISGLYPGEKRALSLAWTAYDPTAVTAPFFGIDTAANGAALVSAFAHFGGPTLNLVWADAEGHIGYHAVGVIPVRGPAVQHPRAVAVPIVEPGATPPDEGTGEPAGDAEPAGSGETEDSGPAAALVMPGMGAESGPRWAMAAYLPVQRRRRRVEAPQVRARGRRVEPARRGRGRQGRAERVEPNPPAHAATPAEPIVPAAPVIDYTIGSAIATGPVDTLDASQAWSGYIPYDAMPAVLDPKNGYLATANARVTPDDYPYAVTLDWTDPFRVERITHMLANRRGLTAEDMLRMQTDVHSDVDLQMAQRLAYAVDHASAKGLGRDAARLHEAANLLRAWDGDMRVDSPAAAVVTAVRAALWPALLVPQIEAHDGGSAADAARWVELYTWGERTTALELLLQHQPARWLPKGSGNWSDFLAGTMAQALRQAHAPSNLSKWQYGALHKVEIAHPVFGMHPLISRVLGVRASSGAQPAPGDGTTVDAIGAHFGPSERFTADLSTADGGLGNVTTGESGHPRSPWYFDQFGAWLEGRSFALPGAGTEVAHSLTLVP